MGISFWLFVFGFILELLGFLNSIRILKKLKGKIVIQRHDDNILDKEEKRLLKLNVFWTSLIGLGAILDFIAFILSQFTQKF